MLNIGGLVALRPRAINVGVILLLIQIFLWISADFVYGQYAAQVRNILIIYFLMFLVTRLFTGGKPAATGAGEKWSSFILIFVLTSAVLIAFSAFGGFQGIASLTSAIPAASAVGISALGFGALHAFVKAYIEEDVFRDALPKYAGLGDIASNILFGLFHFAVLFTSGVALTVIWLPILVLIMLGVVWSYVRNYYGILGSVASHFAWNLFAFGALTPIFVGGLV